MNEIHKSALTAVNDWFYFCMNYVSDYVEINGQTTIAPKFFDAFPTDVRGHLYDKFVALYAKYGSFSAVMRLYAELSDENRRRLVDWMLDNYHNKNGISLD